MLTSYAYDTFDTLKIGYDKCPPDCRLCEEACAKRVFVAMTHTEKKNKPKIVRECTYALPPT